METNFQDEKEQLISSDISDLCAVASRLVYRLIVFDFGFSALKFIASIAAIFLLILDGRTYRKTRYFTSLLITYIFFSLPSWVFCMLRGEFGKWIAFIVVAFRLFSPRRFPDCLKFAAVLILLVVVAPDLFANTLRSSVIGVVICFISACNYQTSAGCKDSCILEEVGIILLLLSPIWTFVLYIVGALLFVARGLTGI